MGIRFAAQNFTKGEVSPEVEARFDLDVYHAALRKASNVIIKRTGGVKKRPGSRFVAQSPSSSYRILPFQFSDSQAYCLGFGQGFMQPYALGGAVLETGLAVTAITQAAQAQVTCAYHGYSVGDPIWFDGIQGMTDINDRFLNVVSVIDANTFTVNYDSTNASPFTGDTGGHVNTAPPSTPAPIATPTPTPAPAAPIVTSGGSGGTKTGQILNGGTM